MPQQKKLSNNQIKFLRGIAHGLNPVIIIGGKGAGDSLMEELEKTLSHHELIKIKISIGDKEERKQVTDYILDQTQADLVQSIGKILVIYRAKEKPELELPRH